VDTRDLYDGLEALYLPVALAVVAMFWLVVAHAVVRYRRRDDRLPSQRAESRVEYAYAALLVGVAAALVAVTFHTEDKIDGPSESRTTAARPPLRVEVVAAQWRWTFRYPDQGITVRSRGNPALVVPTGTRIAFTGTSRDVTHAFFVPERRFKIQLFSGTDSRWDLTWPRPSDQDGLAGECTFICGLYHARMRFRVRAVSPAQFQAWARRAGGRA
jgi:cytochrome c oxidase subunit II